MYFLHAQQAFPTEEFVEPAAATPDVAGPDCNRTISGMRASRELVTDVFIRPCLELATFRSDEVHTFPRSGDGRGQQQKMVPD